MYSTHILATTATTAAAKNQTQKNKKSTQSSVGS